VKAASTVLRGGKGSYGIACPTRWRTARGAAMARLSSISNKAARSIFWKIVERRPSPPGSGRIPR
jgi:hypothetical protein